jgi:hypothetical protein
MNFAIKSLILHRICLLLSLNLICINISAQDFHQRDAKSVEELIYQQDPNKAKAIFKKGKYLVLENLRRNSRTRFYEGDIFRFKTKDDFVYEDDIYSISDSSFVITTLNEVTNRYEFVEIKLNEVERVYKHSKKEVKINLLTFVPVGYLFIEWAAWNVSPLSNEKLPLAIGLSLAQPLIRVISNQFRSRKLTENYRLRIFQSF